MLELSDARCEDWYRHVEQFSPEAYEYFLCLFVGRLEDVYWYRWWYYQALVLKYLLFATEDEKDTGTKTKPALRSSPLKPLQTGNSDAADVKLIFSDAQRTR